MKYDFLEPLQSYLKENLTPNTARTYYSAVTKLFSESQFTDVSQIPREYLEKQLVERFSTRNEFSAAKNGLKWMARLYPGLQLPAEEYFHSQSVRKRNFSKRPKKVIFLHPVERTINQISDEGLRYAYRLALISGLRVSELAELRAGDLAFEGGRIYVTVRHGKGGHGGVIQCRPDAYLYDRLKAYTQGHGEGRLFYGEAYLRREANRLGFECHDLRRAYAIMTRNELKKKMPAAQADAIVQENLRHARFSTTKRYLYNRKLKMEYEHEPENKKQKEL